VALHAQLSYPRLNKIRGLLHTDSHVIGREISLREEIAYFPVQTVLGITGVSITFSEEGQLVFTGGQNLF